MPEQINYNIEDWFVNIPEELKLLCNWVCFRIEAPDKEGEKPKKVPYQVNGYHASSTVPATWTSFKECLEALRLGQFDGISFSFMNTPYMGFDFDDCVNPSTGEIAPAARAIIERLDSYTEVSTSGTGIHILMKGRLPGGGRKGCKVAPGCEAYDTSRFFCCTGDRIGTRGEPEERTDQMAELYHHLWPPQPELPPAAPVKPSPLTDAEIIERATASASKKFTPLWHGEWQGLYPSQSEADLALCMILAFWTGNDSARMDLLFRTSGLYRKKWDKAYSRNTIKLAVERTQATYTPALSDEEEDWCHRASQSNAPLPRDTSVAKINSPAHVVDETDRIIGMIRDHPPESYDLHEVAYLIEPIIPRGTLVLITGQPGHGKSTLVMKWCQEMAQDGNEIVYLDRDNPIVIVQERLQRFGGKIFPNMMYWGFWSLDFDRDKHPIDPPAVESELLTKIVKHLNRPVIVIDTFRAFSGCDENDNAAVGATFQYLQALTHLGATVLVIHHTTKDGSSPYRGASAMEGAVDAGLQVVSTITDGKITDMEVRTFKTRLGDGKPILYKMVDGIPERVTATQSDLLLQLVQRNFGLSKDKFEALAKTTYGYRRQFVRDWIEHNLVAGKLKYEKAGREGKLSVKVPKEPVSVMEHYEVRKESEKARLDEDVFDTGSNQEAVRAANRATENEEDAADEQFFRDLAKGNLTDSQTGG